MLLSATLTRVGESLRNKIHILKSTNIYFMATETKKGCSENVREVVKTVQA